MLIHEHEQISEKIFGDKFTDVHLWLDEFCIYTMDHQKYRHNNRGIDYIREEWGEQAVRAALQHLKDDHVFYVDEEGIEQIPL